MIESVEIQNFKNIRHQRIELEPLTVFVGANGSGKTSVLEALLFGVRAAAELPKGISNRKRQCDRLYRRGGEGDMLISCQTRFGGFTLSAKYMSLFPPSAEDLGEDFWEFKVLVQNDITLREVLLPALPLSFLRPDPARLAKPSYSRYDPPRLESGGSGLASTLAHMALNDPDAFENLLDYMRGLIPRFKRIRFRKAPIRQTEKEYLRVGADSLERRLSRTYLGEEILFDFAKAEGLPARMVSEGTLMLLGLLAVLLGPSRPKIVLMDDLERGLHPLAQKSLLSVLRQVIGKSPDLQILATAHSPYLLDHLRPEEIRLMTIDEDGNALCGRLEDHPQFDKWKDEMAPGELWSLFGEKWLAQGSEAQ